MGVRRIHFFLLVSFRSLLLPLTRSFSSSSSFDSRLFTLTDRSEKNLKTIDFDKIINESDLSIGIDAGCDLHSLNRCSISNLMNQQMNEWNSLKGSTFGRDLSFDVNR